MRRMHHTLRRRLWRVCSFIGAILCMTFALGLLVDVCHAEKQVVRVGVGDVLHNHPHDETHLIQDLFQALLEDIADKEDWRIEVVEKDRETLLGMLRTGELDLLMAEPVSRAEDDSLLVSMETVMSTWGQVYVKNGVKIQSFLDLEGKAVVFLDGDHYFNEFKKIAERFNINCDLITAKSYRDVLSIVDRGFVDAGVVERTHGVAITGQYAVEATPLIFSPSELRFAASSDSSAEYLHAIDYNLVLYKRDQNSIYYVLMDHYFGPESRFKFPTWLKVTLVGVALLLLILLVTTLILRKQVELQTRELSRANVELKEEILVRKAQEADLLRLGTVVEQMIEGVIITGVNGDVVYVNPSFESMMGMRKEDVLGSSYARLLRGTADDVNRAQIEEMMQMVRLGNPWRGRFAYEHKNNAVSELEASVLPIVNANHEAVNNLCILRDLTHETLLERQLRQSQKLEAIGTLAGGIAHDFNNTLFTMMGQTDLAMMLIEKESPAHKKLQRVIQAGHRAKDLVRQILTFSRQSENERRVVELQAIIKETMTLIRPALPTSIEIRTDFEAKGVMVETDPTQVHQILLNLCTNAAHALPAQKGVLDVRLQTVTIQESATDLNVYPGDYVQLSVRDNGTGMPKRILDRIFEPFYSTKPKGEGTGMGLAVVHGIVESHQGAITVESEVGHGTVFHIYLPVIQGEAAPELQQDEEDSKGSERIMVVDDEEAVTEVVCQMLDHLGYEVEGYTDSREALRVFREQPRSYDLLVTDFSMPGLTGAELCERVLAIRAGLAIIMITGYGQYMTTESAREIGVQELMMKPILTHDLSEVVRRVLDGDVEPRPV